MSVNAILTQQEKYPYNSNPSMNGTASPGSSINYARGDHVHPSDTSKADAKTGIYYGTCSTAANEQIKQVTFIGDLPFSRLGIAQNGFRLSVRFSYGQSYVSTSENPIKLQLSSFTAYPITLQADTSSERIGTGEWTANEVVDFVWYSGCWAIINRSHASTDTYGYTKLSSAVNSEDESSAATPKAVKAAYDLALATEQQIATVETGTTASRAYKIGDYFSWEGQLCRAKTAIAIGDTLTVDSNCTITTLGEQMNQEYTFSEPSGNSNFTNISGKIIKNGNIVFIDLELTTSSSAISQNTKILNTTAPSPSVGGTIITAVTSAGKTVYQGRVNAVSGSGVMYTNEEWPASKTLKCKGFYII